MPDPLERYRRMRDFAATPEPSGEPVGEPPDPEQPRFVIQQHDATRLHWDLRLEHEGVLESFALPRGLPWSPDRNRLAVHTEEHPIEYLEFHGEIPEGEYGAGTMTIWDRGTYEVDKWDERDLTVVLDGQRLRGRYTLFQTDGRNWMIHRKDPPQDPERRPVPEDLRPMQATEGRLPIDGWAYEIRWAGIRALLTNEPGHLTVTDERGNELTDRFPEVRRIGRSLGAVECVLDGVVVALDQQRQPVVDRQRLERRLEASSRSRIGRLAQDRPVAAMLFDVVWLEGHRTTELAYEDRRRLLEDFDLRGSAWQTPGHHMGEGPALLEVARRQELPGLVAKRLGSPYRPGAVSDDWVQVSASR